MITFLWWFLLYIDMNWPQAYMCPLHPEPPSHLPHRFSSLHAASISHFTLFKEFCLFYSYTKAFE